MARPELPAGSPSRMGARAAARIAWSFLDRGSRIRLIVSATLSSLTSIMDLAALVVLGPWLAQITAGATQSAVRLPLALPGVGSEPAGPTTLLVVVALYLLRLAAASALLWWNVTFVGEARVALADRAFRRFLDASPESALGRDRGRYQFVVAEGPNRVGEATLLGLGAGGDFLSACAVVAGLVLIDATTTLVALVFLAGLVWSLTRAARGAARRAGRGIAESVPLLNRLRLEALATFREIALYSEREHVASRHRHVAETGVRTQMGLSFLGQLNRFILEFAVVAGIAVGATWLSVSRRSPSEIAASLALLAVAGFRLAPTLNRLASTVTSLRSQCAPLAVFAEEMIALDGARATTEPSEIRLGTLVLENVRYRYPGQDRPAIDQVSLALPSGRSLALVGPSGAGKTTLGLLLAGLLEPSAGSISVTDRAVSANRFGVGIVPQEVALIRGSIADNIAFSWGAVAPDRLRLEESAAAAGLSALLADLPGGLDAQVGDAGSTLSAGQRQRVGLARALYRRPALLVLDEATSALDAETERFVTDAVAALRGQVTTVIIAHRLHTVRACDQIAFLDGGRLVASGNFEDLARTVPAFHRMVELSALRA